MIFVFYIIMMYGEVQGKFTWECFWVFGMMGLEVRREGQYRDMDWEL